MFETAQARQLCEDLSLARGIPKVLRDQARHELYAHAPSAVTLFPSWRDKRLAFVAPPGWRPMNHSITAHEGGLLTAVRCTCYVIDDRGPRMIEQTPHFSRTFLLRVSPDDLSTRQITELFLLEPGELLNPTAPAGFEDMRIFPFGGELWGVMTRCDENEEGWPEQWLGSIHGDTICNLQLLRSPEQRRPEKNWIPFVANKRLCFIYLCDPTTILDANAKVWGGSRPEIACDHFRGSSQGIPYDGGLLALVHTCTIDKLWPKNLIRFVWFDDQLRLSRISDAFRFEDRFEQEYLRGIQYAMGMCFHPDGKRLLVSYSLGDGQSWIGDVGAADVAAQLRSV
jgi:hypothetical protein